MRLYSGFLAGLFLLAALFAPMHHAQIHQPMSDSYILIDKSENKLTYYYYKQPIRTFKVATGANPADTPNGVFEVVMMVKNPWYLKKNIPGGDPDNPLGVRWIGIEVPGTDGSKYGIHGTNRPDSIGNHVSAGCVRMTNGDVSWLYDRVKVGTLVEIVD
ncbi:L,D-transpeptidase [Tumebacillus sp. DT12]|uniref:L,D-transpeptidase n=1 Tax=Tumebacillus lacus TaxID=2995335 RepID=A0ABT3X5Q9_9BACL|nr:L,D-transpeptidase [Tumebacillus lacus]MCX7570966.1 L,D-transpeptidase [Tumebacillus lacus]